MIGQIFDTRSLASKSGYNDRPSKSTSWKVLETCPSHLNNIKFPRGNYQPTVPQQKYSIVQKESLRANTIMSRDQFKSIRIGENLAVNYKLVNLPCMCTFPGHYYEYEL